MKSDAEVKAYFEGMAAGMEMAGTLLKKYTETMEKTSKILAKKDLTIGQMVDEFMALGKDLGVDLPQSPPPAH